MRIVDALGDQSVLDSDGRVSAVLDSDRRVSAVLDSTCSES